MPLRDHFHLPLSGSRDWVGLFSAWPTIIIHHLLPYLPADYFAESRISLGGGSDIFVVGADESPLWTSSQPILNVETDLPDYDEFEVRVYEAGRRLVGAVELVSPANKDSPESRRAFVAKCAALLAQEVSVTIVDTVTKHDFNLYGELLESLRQPAPADEGPICAISCRGRRGKKRWRLKVWGEPLAVGKALPTLPLWLSDEHVLALDLEATYEETCRTLRID